MNATESDRSPIPAPDPAVIAEAVAAERERCAQLAESVRATYVCYGTDLDPIRTRKSFAALLREP